MDERTPCPACGGAGGGPFGRAGGAWDDEEFECARCEGVGQILKSDSEPSDAGRPGLAKTATPTAKPGERKRTG